MPTNHALLRILYDRERELRRSIADHECGLSKARLELDEVNTLILKHRSFRDWEPIPSIAEQDWPRTNNGDDPDETAEPEADDGAPAPEPAPTEPPKRGRGRPRKHPLPEAAAPAPEPEPPSDEPPLLDPLTGEPF